MIKQKFRNILSSPTRAFVLLATLFGSAVILLSPPLTGLDEEAHFVRAWGIANGQIVLKNEHRSDVNAPKSFRKTIGCFQNKNPEPGQMYRYDYRMYGEDKKSSFTCALNVPLEQDSVEIVGTSAPQYSPTTYVPQILAILLGRLLDAPIVLIVYFVRFAVLATYIALIYVAIRLLPVRKWALVGVALMPLSLAVVTNPGGDSMLLGLVAVFLAIIVRSVYIPRRDLDRERSALLITLAVVSVLMMLPKGFFPGICFLPLLLFFGGYSKFLKSKITILLTALLIGYAWYKFGAPHSAEQSIALHNAIINFPHEFMKTMFYRWTDTDFIYTGDIVTWMDGFKRGDVAGMPAIVVTIMNVLMAVYIFVRYPEKVDPKISNVQVSWLSRIGVLIALGVVCGSFAALYIVVSVMQNGSGIWGVQTRYFYVAFMLLSVLPFTRYLQVSNIKVYTNIVAVGSAVLLTTLLLTLMIKFNWWIF